MQPRDMSIKERNIQSMKMHQAALDLKRNLEETHVMYGDFIGGTLFGVSALSAFLHFSLLWCVSLNSDGTNAAWRWSFGFL